MDMHMIVVKVGKYNTKKNNDDCNTRPFWTMLINWDNKN